MVISTEKARAVKPDYELIYEARRITAASNVYTIREALKSYEHWCLIGNESAADAAAQTLRGEICKAWENFPKQRKEAS